MIYLNILTKTKRGSIYYMKPVLKYRGGKTREIKYFEKYIPKEFDTYIEPFVGGCPGRQLFLSGEGDGDAAVFVIGMIVGAAFAHNFGLASSGSGATSGGMIAVVVGFIACALIGFTMREKMHGRARKEVKGYS
jgi:hypothetical protein